MKRISLANSARWAARILEILTTGVILMFAIGEGVSNPLAAWSRNELIMLAFFIMPVAGSLVAWKREGAGAVIMLAGAILFGGWDLFSSGNGKAFIIMIPWAVAATLHIVSLYFSQAPTQDANAL